MGGGTADSIVVTGLGVVSPLGIGVERFHESLSGGRSGIVPIQVPWATGYEFNQAGVVTELGLPAFVSDGIGGTDDRSHTFARIAGHMALEQAGLHNPRQLRRCAVIVGTTWGAALEVERSTQPGPTRRSAGNGEAGEPHAYNGISARLKTELGLGGPDLVVTTTCAAGNHAISMATDLVQAGAADAALAVGVDALAYLVLLGFSRLLLQSPDRCRPFDLNRTGTILAEGAGALLVEPAARAKRRGAEILAEVAGCGLSCDAAGPFEGNATDVRSLHIAAEAAFREARCKPEDIDYVSAHGSATQLNDRKETFFLKSLLGDRAYDVPVSSIKSMIGHAQGAAAALEAIACILSLNRGVIYPTVNLETPDPECDLDYVANEARDCRPDTILSNAFGLGGNNALVIFRRWNHR